MIIIAVDAIKIEQIKTNLKAYLYPTADVFGHTGLNCYPNTGEDNFEDVDDIRNFSDEDSTYVWTNLLDTVKEDRYELQNFIPEGDLVKINFIRLHGRMKSHEGTFPTTGIAKFLVSNFGGFPGVWYSTNQQLSDSYYNYIYTWRLNPATGNPWTNGVINNLHIGLQFKTTASVSEKTLILRPNGDNAVNLSRNGCNFNFECVDEETKDDNTSYVYKDGPCNEVQDMYDMENHGLALPDENIQSVTIYAYVANNGATISVVILYIKVGANTKTSNYFLINNANYILKTKTWYNAPGNVPWTWAAINQLLAGISMTAVEGDTLKCTQLYAEVKYYESTPPELRCTQLYAEVDYDSSCTCYLPKPEEISRNHQRNVKIINFWNGDREVFDVSRKTKNMVLRGKVWDEVGEDTACEKIQCVRDMGRAGNIITISGNGFGNCFNGNFRIKSFGWKKRFDKPISFDWYLELEDADK